MTWLLTCGHSVYCAENHHTGQEVYCTKCNKNSTIWTWLAKRQLPEATAHEQPEASIGE